MKNLFDVKRRNPDKEYTLVLSPDILPEVLDKLFLQETDGFSYIYNGTAHDRVEVKEDEDLKFLSQNNAEILLHSINYIGRTFRPPVSEEVRCEFFGKSSFTDSVNYLSLNLFNQFTQFVSVFDEEASFTTDTIALTSDNFSSLELLETGDYLNIRRSIRNSKTFRVTGVDTILKTITCEQISLDDGDVALPFSASTLGSIFFAEVLILGDLFAIILEDMVFFDSFLRGQDGKASNSLIEESFDDYTYKLKENTSSSINLNLDYPQYILQKIKVLKKGNRL